MLEGNFDIVVLGFRMSITLLCLGGYRRDPRGISGSRGEDKGDSGSANSELGGSFFGARLKGEEGEWRYHSFGRASRPQGGWRG